VIFCKFDKNLYGFLLKSSKNHAIEEYLRPKKQSIVVGMSKKSAIPTTIVLLEIQPKSDFFRDFGWISPMMECIKQLGQAASGLAEP
jgi:hypothetical protein